MQELAISAVGVDDHSSRHFTAMHRSVQENSAAPFSSSSSRAICAALHPAHHFSSKDVSTGINIVRTKCLLPRDQVQVQCAALCAATQMRPNQFQPKLQQLSFWSLTAFYPKMIPAVCSTVYHSANRALAFKFNAIQSQAVSVL